MRRYFTARMLGIHILALLAIVSCLALSHWQWTRAHGQTSVAKSPSGEFASLSPLGNYLPLASVGVQTEVQGTWSDKGRFLVTERPTHGPSLINPNPGSNVVVSWAIPIGAWVCDVLLLEDGSAVGVVRGWSANPQSVPPAQGMATVTGILQSSEDADYVSLVSVPELLTTKLVLSHSDVSVHDGYLVAQQPAQGLVTVDPIYSAAPKTSLHIRNVIYTFNWIFFALLVIAMWVRVVRDGVKGAISI